MLQISARLKRALGAAVLASSLAFAMAGCPAPEPDLPPNVFSWTFPQQPGQGDAQTQNICAHFVETGSCKNAKIPTDRWVKVNPETRFDSSNGVTKEEYAAGWILRQWQQGKYKPITGEDLLLKQLEEVNGPDFVARWQAYGDAGIGITPSPVVSVTASSSNRS